MKKLFGTDGIRGKAGFSPITPEEVYKLAYIFAKKTNYRNIAIGWDTRESSLWIANAVISGLKDANSNSEILGCVPTPVLAYTVKENFDGGIMITASHNPFEDNGLKFFNGKGEKIETSIEKEVEKEFFQSKIKPKIENFLKNQLIFNKDLTEKYLLHIAEKISIKSISKTYPVDCANGATSLFIKFASEKYGLDFQPYNTNPNGKNINFKCGAAKPEFIRKNSFAFDGDGDRIMAKDENENIVNGDIILMFLADKLKINKLVGTVMTNMAVEIFCKNRNIQFERTPVGDKFVREKMKEINASLGGETSGHIILSDLNHTGDGFAVYLKMLELFNKENIALKDLTENYPLFPQKVINIPVKEKVPFENIKGFEQLKEKVEEILENEGRFFPRYSGTENLLRILIEGKDKEKIEQCEKIIKEFFNKTEV